MHVVIRSYTGQGAAALFDLIAERESEVRDLLTAVPGFASYTAFRHDGGASTVTVCQDKDGTDESSRRAAAWVAENFEGSADPPQMTEGPAITHF